MTRKDTVRALCKMMMARLEQNKMVEFSPKLRQEIWDKLFDTIGPAILSDEDLREKAIQRIHGKVDALSETAATESDQFKTALKMVKEDLGENELHGLYYQKPIRSIAEDVTSFLMEAPQIDDVFETDEVIQKALVETIQRFNPKDLH